MKEVRYLKKEVRHSKRELPDLKMLAVPGLKIQEQRSMMEVALGLMTVEQHSKTGARHLTKE